MAFKKIWNELKTDVLREELWNELTDEQKISIVNDHPQPQIDRLYERLTSILTDQSDKWYAEWERLWKIRKKILKQGKLGLPKYSKTSILPERDEMIAAWWKI